MILCEFQMMLGLARNVCRPRVLRLGWRSISGGGYKWDILASVCIERPPYITPSLPGEIKVFEFSWLLYSIL